MTPDKKGAPHLFDHWDEIAPRIRITKDIRLFLDLDGTLVSYCPKPEDVALNAAEKRILKRLGRHRRVHVAIVSGRRNDVLRQFVRIPHIQFMGLYGSESEETIRLSRKAERSLNGVRADLASLPAEFPGVWMEDKGVSFAIHFSGAPAESRRELQKRIRQSFARDRTDFRIIRGDRSWEIVPRQVKGKGAAVREFTKGLRSPFLPIYIGDDLTDEPAFKALRHGITVRVGAPAPTKANFRVKDPQEVHAFLERLEEELS